MMVDRPFEIIAGTYWPPFLLGAIQYLGDVGDESDVAWLKSQRSALLSDQHWERTYRDGVAAARGSVAAVGMAATCELVREALARARNYHVMAMTPVPECLSGDP